LSITLVAVAIFFCILTFPYQLFWVSYLIIDEFNGHNLSTNTTTSPPSIIYTNNKNTLMMITFFIKNVNYIINFFLYSVLSRLFRHEFIVLMSSLFCLKLENNSTKQRREPIEERSMENIQLENSIKFNESITLLNT
jgi:hypothetical protein